MAAPTSNYNWANNTVTEVVSIGGNNVLVINKVEPTSAYFDSGVLARQPFPRPYINYTLNSHGDWIEYLRSGEVGDVRWMPEPTTEAEMDARFGGTWTDRGQTSFSMTDPVSTQTLRLFERTA